MKFDLINSTAMRHTLWLCGIFFLSVLIMFGLAYFEAEEELDERMIELIREKDATLLSVYETKGFDGLKQQIDVLSVGAKRGETLLYLTNKTGDVISGNVLEMRVFDGWNKVALDQITLRKKPLRTPKSYFSFGRSFREGHLIIGRNNYQVEEVQEAILEALTQGFLIPVIFTILIGFFLARKSDRRLYEIKQTLKNFTDGNLESRIPVDNDSQDDISRISKDMNNTLHRLASTVESLRQISFDIAHELKTPLQRLRQDLETLTYKKISEEVSTRTVNRTLKETDDIIKIFQALLRISQIEGGSRKSKFTKTDLAEICSKVTEIYEPVAEDNNHHLKTDIQQDTPFVIQGDVDLLTQMVANLLENAITHCTDPSQIDLKLSRNSRWVCLSVCDNGPGIPKSEREKVLERLYRLEKSRTTPGNGLGLSLIKAVADLHDFKIELEDNQPGLKVTLSLSL